ncbi:DNA-directed RNA polymerase subunit delta [Mesobacillus persicus]|uniref:Probable DNA-directed RNA polymerase subunit delta n=1 Tax=Mesobacillus persicus TaxID=930146 RepID=A0A1H8HB09_9BACI|nr:DNA-directed RNA polymerase subunit delta [Mesobacillus persicus]
MLSLKKYSKEDLNEMSWIEIAFELLEEKKQAVSFKELVKEISTLLGVKETEASEQVVQFYTDINIDGRYLSLGENRWGLRVWYPVDQAEEEVVTPVKPRKKKAKKKAVEEEVVEGFDEIEDEDYDDFDDEDDDDLLDDEDLDDDLDEEEDFDEDDDLVEDEEELELDEEELDDDDEEEDFDEEEEK